MDIEFLSKYDLIDLAWAAGILEGEGSFVLSEGKYPRISCGSVDLDVLEKLKTILNCGNLRKNHITSTGKQFYSYTITNKKDVLEILHAILPFMCKRRTAKIEELLNIID